MVLSLSLKVPAQGLAQKQGAQARTGKPGRESQLDLSPAE